MGKQTKKEYVDFTLCKFDDLPPRPGVYVIVHDESRDVIYVGQSTNIARRMVDHFGTGSDNSRFQSFRTENGADDMTYLYLPQNLCEIITGMKGADARRQIESDIITTFYPRFNRHKHYRGNVKRQLKVISGSFTPLRILDTGSALGPAIGVTGALARELV